MTRKIRAHRILSASLCLLCPASWPSPLRAADHRPLPRFERVVIDDDFPGAYQVEVADINGDEKPDIVALGGGTCAWYENPTWKKRVITGPDKTPGVISSASADLDGDGKAEVAIAFEFEMNEPSKGELLLASQGPTPDDPWTLTPLGHFGSIHRLRWGDIDGDERVDLIVAPIFGEAARPPTYDQASAKLVALATRGAPRSKASQWRWEPIPLAERPVIHAIEFLPRGADLGDGARALPGLLTADNLGVALIAYDPSLDSSTKPAPKTHPLHPGATGPAPNRGCSEVHRGRLRRREPSGTSPGRFVATIEPWHGKQVVLWASDPSAPPNAPGVSPVRTVIDDTLDAGHALWVADVDGDGDDEIFAGHRGKDHRVSAYDFDGKTWNRTVIDRDVAAQDLRGGDLDGDGVPDVVAVGGATHNVLWYRPVRDRR